MLKILFFCGQFPTAIYPFLKVKPPTKSLSYCCKPAHSAVRDPWLTACVSGRQSVAGAASMSALLLSAQKALVNTFRSKKKSLAHPSIQPSSRPRPSWCSWHNLFSISLAVECTRIGTSSASVQSCYRARVLVCGVVQSGGTDRETKSARVGRDKGFCLPETFFLFFA